MIDDGDLLMQRKPTGGEFFSVKNNKNQESKKDPRQDDGVERIINLKKRDTQAIKDHRTVFHVPNTNTTILNSIRREFDFLKTLAFESHLVQIKTNSSMMSDHQLRDRVCMLPIDCDVKWLHQHMKDHNDCHCDDKGCFRCQIVFELNVKNTVPVHSHIDQIIVTAQDLQLKLYPEQKAWFSEHPSWKKPSIIDAEKMTLLPLGLEKQLHMQLIARVTNGDIFVPAKPVISSFYRPHVSIVVDPEITLYTTNKQRNDITKSCSAGVFDDYEWKTPLPSNSQHRCTLCLGCVLPIQKIRDDLKKNKTTEKAKVIVMKEIQGNFNFVVETTGATYTPLDACIYSCDSLMQRAQNLLSMVSSLH